MALSVYDEGRLVLQDGTISYSPGSVLSYIYYGVKQGVFPPLIFLGIGAMTDFSTMLSNPKLVLLGAAAQVGIFLTLIGAMYLGFTPAEAGAIGIIGGADGPTAIFLASRLAPHLLGAIAIAAYSYMALVPVIQPPIMKLLTSRKERLIRMKPPRQVTRRERIVFPIVAFLICTLIAPGSLVLIGMLFFGNLLKESMVTERLANTARTAMIDIVTILLGFAVGASTQAQTFLQGESLLIFGLGALSFAVATASGVLFAKFMNLFLREKINPLVGAAGVSAVPDSARVVQMVGQQEDPHNFLLMHAMAPNVAGVIGSAVAAGVLWSVLTM
jgi:oxaloacetate decarboxylase beta subunit